MRSSARPLILSLLLGGALCNPASALAQPPPDRDGDGIPDAIDLCPDVADPGQTDLDQDRLGDGCDPDADNDRLTNEAEQALGTDPLDADSDDDGLADGAELLEDPDGDGLPGPLDPDSDGDGLLDGTEAGIPVLGCPSATDLKKKHFRGDADPTTTTDPYQADTDGGGVPDGFEDLDGNGRLDPGETDPAAAADDPRLPDADADGWPDVAEWRRGTDPTDEDSDDDGVCDGCEADGAIDTDGDGLINALDPDADNDGLADGTELGRIVPGAGTDRASRAFWADADPTTTTSMVSADTDRDGVRDGAEDLDHDGALDPGETDPRDPRDARLAPDVDGDRLPDEEERRIGTDPQDADSDDDGLPDGLEHNGWHDTDGDGLPNARDPDSDGDGLGDGLELGLTTVSEATDRTVGIFVPDADPTTTTSMVCADTDRGGRADGLEDRDRNGRLDDGESDPVDPLDEGDPGLAEGWSAFAVVGGGGWRCAVGGAPGAALPTLLLSALGPVLLGRWLARRRSGRSPAASRILAKFAAVPWRGML